MENQYALARAARNTMTIPKIETTPKSAPAQKAPEPKLEKFPKFQFGVNEDANARELEGVPMIGAE